MEKGELIPQDALVQKLLIEVLVAMTRNYLQHKKTVGKSEGIAASLEAIALTKNEAGGDSDHLAQA